MGTHDFVYIYLAQLAEQGGYEGAAFEGEANTVASDIARERGGEYCQDLAYNNQVKKEKRDVALRVDPCPQKPSTMVWLGGSLR